MLWIIISFSFYLPFVFRDRIKRSAFHIQTFYTFSVAQILYNKNVVFLDEIPFVVNLFDISGKTLDVKDISISKIIKK